MNLKKKKFRAEQNGLCESHALSKAVHMTLLFQLCVSVSVWVYLRTCSSPICMCVLWVLESSVENVSLDHSQTDSQSCSLEAPYSVCQADSNTTSFGPFEFLLPFPNFKVNFFFPQSQITHSWPIVPSSRMFSHYCKMTLGKIRNSDKQTPDKMVFQHSRLNIILKMFIAI